MIRHMFFAIACIALLATACAPVPSPAAAPTLTQEPMMPKETPTAGAMMDKGSPTAEAMMPKGTPEAMMKIPDQIFAAHFVDSAPKHGDKFAKTPDKVLINFNFTLHEDSTINVTQDGAQVAVGKPVLGERKLSMSATLPSNAGDGLYVVDYKACWPDRSCHDGRLAFVVDSKTQGAYLDMTGKREITIQLKGIRFNPQQVVIRKGTTVTWVNQDPVTHFVNSDPHPTHNFLPALNSLEIPKGGSYSYTFDHVGEWVYHCSAHVPDNMLGRIIVLDSAS